MAEIENENDGFTVTATTPLLADDDEVSEGEAQWQSSIEEDSRDVTTATDRAADDSCRSVVLRLLTLGFAGSILGLVSRKSSDLHGAWYPTLSACIGYTYFFMWSVSFYPQVVSNYRRRTTVGLSADFAALNVLGFSCYATYNIAFFTSDIIRKEYFERFPNSEISVQSNDVAFAVHAVLLSSITMFQIGYYDGFSSQQTSKWISLFIGVALLCISTYPFAMLAGFGNCLNYLYMLSYIKISITLLKYIPQVLLNFHRKSTTGWSIWQILLDLSGGLLSDSQLILDCWNTGGWSGITGNIAKFCLGSISILFDIVFMVQHYVLYSSSGASTPEVAPLVLQEDSNEHDLDINAVSDHDEEL